MYTNSILTYKILKIIQNFLNTSNKATSNTLFISNLRQKFFIGLLNLFFN